MMYNIFRNIKQYIIKVYNYIFVNIYNTFDSILNTEDKWDYGFCFQYYDDIGKLLVFDGIAEWGIFFKFLICDDIKTVYITDIYGTFRNGFVDIDDIIVNNYKQLDDKIWKYVIPKLFRNYKTVPFNINDYNKNKKQFCMNNVYEVANILSNKLPCCLTRSIINLNIPNWIRYKYILSNSIIFEETNHDIIMDKYFYDIPNVHNKIIFNIVGETSKFHNIGFFKTYIESFLDLKHKNNNNKYILTLELYE